MAQQWGPDEVHALIERVEVVRDNASKAKQKILDLYENLDPEHDARVTSLSKLINVLNSLQLGLTFTAKHLLHHNWWELIAKSPISVDDKRIYANEFGNFLKVAFVQALQSSVESAMRIVLRALDADACNRGTAEFKSIYDCLFSSKLAEDLRDEIPTLDLLRHVRNTVHNNGVYFHKKEQDQTVVWREAEYAFRHGVAVDFVTWDLLLDLTDSLREVLVRVLSDKHLRNIEEEIRDPFSDR